jgi:hypothetical protein
MNLLDLCGFYLDVDLGHMHQIAQIFLGDAAHSHLTNEAH